MNMWRIVDLFIHPRLKLDPENLRSARQLVVFGAVGVLLFYPVNAVKWFKVGSPELAVSLLGCLVLSAAMVVVLRLTGSLWITGNGILAGLAWHFAFLPYLTGGFESKALAWNLLVPVFASTFLGFRSAAFWMAVMLAEILGYYYLARTGVQLPGLVLTPEQAMTTGASNLVGPLLAGFITCYILDRTRREALNSLAQALDLNREALAEQGVAQVRMENLTGHLGSVVAQVGENAQRLSQSAQGLTQLSGDMAGRARLDTEQAQEASHRALEVNQNLGAVSDAVERNHVSLEEVAGNAEQAVKVSDEAMERARRSNAAIEHLGQSSRQIDRVTQAITDIADQVNLLALNATIEAARAGASGKGFAVVASEIKQLALRASKATKEINGQITGVQREVANVIEEIRQISTIINQVADLQHSIAAAVEEQNRITSDIRTRVRQAVTGGRQIADNVGTLADSARMTQAGVTDLNQSAELLGNMARELIEACQYDYDTASAA